MVCVMLTKLHNNKKFYQQIVLQTVELNHGLRSLHCGSHCFCRSFVIMRVDLGFDVIDCCHAAAQLAGRVKSLLYLQREFCLSLFGGFLKAIYLYKI